MLLTPCSFNFKNYFLQKQVIIRRRFCSPGVSSTKVEKSSLNILHFIYWMSLLHNVILQLLFLLILNIASRALHVCPSWKGGLSPVSLLEGFLCWTFKTSRWATHVPPVTHDHITNWMQNLWAVWSIPSQCKSICHLMLNTFKAIRLNTFMLSCFISSVVVFA